MSLEVRIRKKLAGFMLDVSFESEEGIFAVLGETGTGKTMMLKCIAGVETPDEGRIVLNGKVLFDSIEKINVPSYQRKTGLLFQGYALFPTMTIEQNIRLALEGGGAASLREESGADAGPEKTKLAENTKVAELLGEYRLDGLGGEYPADLSCAQRQRAAMARMMAASPELVLLDEPFEKLSGYLKADLLYEIRDRINKRKLPAVFVSGDMDEVYAMADKVCVIKDGRTLETKDKKEFFRRPETISGALLTGCRNVTDVVLVDQYHALAKDWGTMFCFVNEEKAENGEPSAESMGKKWKKLPAGMKAIGFYSYDLTMEPAAGQDGKALPGYKISVYQDRIDEDMRDYYVYFRPVRDPKAHLMLWQISKNEISPEELEKVTQLYIENSRILLLGGL